LTIAGQDGMIGLDFGWAGKDNLAVTAPENEQKSGISYQNIVLYFDVKEVICDA
jgi:hypothetical protein